MAVETVKGGSNEPDVTTYRYLAAAKQRPIMLPEDCGETNEFSKIARGATWPDGATIQYDHSGVPDEHKEAIEAGFTTWEGPTELTFETEEGAQSFVTWVPEDGLGDIHVICPGCDRRTTYPATRRPLDELRNATPDSWM